MFSNRINDFEFSLILFENNDYRFLSLSCRFFDLYISIDTILCFFMHTKHLIDKTSSIYYMCYVYFCCESENWFTKMFFGYIYELLQFLRTHFCKWISCYIHNHICARFCHFYLIITPHFETSQKIIYIYNSTVYRIELKKR